MKIHDIVCRKEAAHTELACRIDRLDLWFRFPIEFALDPLDATCFVGPALLPSMLLGEDLIVDKPYFVSEKLLNSLAEIQAIYHHWNPLFRPIKVIAKARAIERDPVGRASFFSGGVDGAYSLCKHQDEIDYLVLINGFDFNMGNTTWHQMVDKNRDFAAHFGKRLVAVETNYKAFAFNTGIHRVASFGTCLAAISHALGFSKVLFSGSATYEHLYPDGVHAILDPLWSTELTQTVHTGLSADRSKKIALVKEYPEAIKRLWVCWQDPRWNCGKCSKCFRTYVALRLNNVRGVEFKRDITLDDVRKLTIKTEHSCIFFEHFWNQAVEQEDEELAAILGRIIGRFKLQKFFAEFEQYVLQGRLKRIKRRLRPEKSIGKLNIERHWTDQLRAEQAIEKLRAPDFVQDAVNIGSIYFDDPTNDDEPGA